MQYYSSSDLEEENYTESEDPLLAAVLHGSHNDLVTALKTVAPSNTPTAGIG
jgi:hypothetical protein